MSSRGVRPALVVTSVSQRAWRAAEEAGFAGTLLEEGSPVGVNVWVYHEHGFDTIMGRTSLPAPQAPPGRSDVCMVDLFAACRGLPELITSGSSCIDAFYSIGGAREPFEFMLRVQSAKIWVRRPRPHAPAHSRPLPLGWSRRRRRR